MGSFSGNVNPAMASSSDVTTASASSNPDNSLHVRSLGAGNGSEGEVGGRGKVESLPMNYVQELFRQFVDEGTGKHSRKSARYSIS